MDDTQWFQELTKRYAHLRKRKLPAAFLKRWKLAKTVPPVEKSLRDILVFAEEMLVIKPGIMNDHPEDEELMWHIRLLESLYPGFLQPVEGTGFSRSLILHNLKYSDYRPSINLRTLLNSTESSLWKTLQENPPPLRASEKKTTEWFMHQSKAIKICLDQFYCARSYDKAGGYLIAVFYFMENIYYLTHRLSLTKLSTQT